MTTDEIDQVRRQLSDAQRRAGELLARLEDAVMRAHADGAPVSEIARAAGCSRPRVYGILRRAGVEIDSTRGRALARHRWDARDAAEDLVSPPPARELEGYLAQRRAEAGDRPVSMVDLDFAAVDDGPVPDSISVLDAIAQFRARARES